MNPCVQLQVISYWENPRDFAGFAAFLNKQITKKPRHGAAQSGHEANIEVAPPGPKKARSALSFAPGVTSVFALCPDCAARRRDFFANDATSASH